MSYCKEANVPLPFQDIIMLKFLANKQENIFGKYDKNTKDILKSREWFMTGVGELGNRPHCRILGREDGCCYFYDEKEKQCMLGDYRPSRCD